MAKTKRKKRNYPTNKRKKYSGPTLNQILIAAGILAAAFLYIIYGDIAKSERIHSLQTLVENKSNDHKLETNVLEIATKFVCSCGECKKKSLDICKCDVAIRERQFIREKLIKKEHPDSIIVALNREYGLIKPHFKDKYIP
ncbi:MAG: hypothetical protein D8M58_17460 [Calditrichaeota bacterium]|nr:MAG: hypothetical protein DWQ03_01375 [Calditrichota bacterium]MBL1207195.1 hypothetical protein [Calditrichota bacterium]NOG47028.1 hypothetical protein [Calditrichota bacterium]